MVSLHREVAGPHCHQLSAAIAGDANLSLSDFCSVIVAVITVLSDHVRGLYQALAFSRTHSRYVQCPGVFFKQKSCRVCANLHLRRLSTNAMSRSGFNICVLEQTGAKHQEGRDYIENKMICDLVL